MADPPHPPTVRTSSEWPSTPWTLIRGARLDPAERRAALERLAALYVAPVRRFFVRVLRLDAENADDVTQELFARLIERDFLSGLADEKSLRGFMKLVCRRQCANWRAAEASRRRTLFAAARDEAAPVDEGAALDAEIRAEYVTAALERLRAILLERGKGDSLAIFEARTRFDGAAPEDYAALAERLGRRVAAVRKDLSTTRKLFRRELLRLVAERSDDPREELRALGLARFAR